MKIKLLFMLLLVWCKPAFAQAVAHEPEPLIQCNSEVFDLNQTIPEILMDQDPQFFVVTFFNTQSDAETNSNAIATPEFYIGQMSEIIYARVTSLIDDSFDITSFEISFEITWVEQFPDVTVCDYFELPFLQSGAEGYYTEPSGGGYMFSPGDFIETSMTLYLYYLSGSCESESSFSITVVGDISGGLQSLSRCSTEDAFDLTEAFTQLMVIAPNSDPSIHMTYEDAASGSNPMDWFTPFSWEFGTGTLYVRVHRGDCDPVVKPLLLETIECSNATISGTVRADFDLNGCSTSDPALPVFVISNQSGGETRYAYTNAQGQYAFTNVQEGSNIVNANTVYLPDFMTVNAPDSYNFAMGPDDNATANFCVTFDPTNDLAITLIPLDQPRPGFGARYRVYLQNLGTLYQDANATLVFDDVRLDVVSAAGGTVSGNEIHYSLGSMAPLSTVTYEVLFTVAIPPVADAGDVLHFEAFVIADPDADLTNNVTTLAQIIVNSYDPNDIIVHEGAFITQTQAQDYLHYTIRFQNTGTADAINVRLENELSAFLDEETFRPVAASHTYHVERSGSMLQIRFENINLASEQENEPLSHGFFTYRVKPVSGFSEGDVIENSAGIFFDFNAPIITNIAATQIQSLGVSGPSVPRITVAPNPTSGQIEIAGMSGTVELEVFDLSGKKLKSEILGEAFTADVSGLASGIYMLRLSNGSSASNHKLIVK